MNGTLRFSIIFILIGFFIIPTQAQKNPKNVILKIVDAENAQLLPYASYTNSSTQKVYTANEEGFIQLNKTPQSGEVKHMGYEPASINIHINSSDTLLVHLNARESKLKEVKITRSRYRNKGNPAVELIRQVVAHRTQNQPSNNHEHLSYQKYEKFNTGAMFHKGVIPKVPLLPSLNVLFENYDSTTFKDNNIFPLLLEENVYKYYYQNNPQKENEVHLGNKQIRFDEKYINNRHASQALRFIYDDLDIYQPEILLFSRNILSPVSGLGPQFYKYYLGDTLFQETQNPIVELHFEPRSPKSPLFNGMLKIQLTDYAIKEAEIYLSPEANINFIEQSKIQVFYQKIQDQYFIDEMYSFTVVAIMDSMMKSYLERSVIIDQINTVPIAHDSFFTMKVDPDQVIKDYDQEFWEKNRPVPLTQAEEKHYENFDSLKQKPFFKRLQNWGSFLFTGYKQVGQWEIGNLNTFFNQNDVEGFKPRIGARSTPRFSKSWYMNVNVGYGFKDEKLKYKAQVIKSFNQQSSVFEFPHNYIAASHEYDIRFPGQDMQVIDQTNLLENIRSEVANRVLYNRRSHLQYVRDWTSSFQTRVSLQHVEEKAGGILANLPEEQLSLLNYQSASALLFATWAPGQEMLQQKSTRTILPNTKPVFRAELEWAPKALTINDYPFFKWNASIFKRTYLGPFGKLETDLSYGKIVGDMPYTMLFTPSTNTSYLFNKRSFNLLDYSELVTDEYIRLRAEWQWDGWLFNRIPLFNRLRLREVVGLHAMAGQLSKQNQPDYNSDLPSFPKNDDGEAFVQGFDWDKPYIEFNVGIMNILKVIRVDYITRLTHLKSSSKHNHGVKLSIHFSF